MSMMAETHISRDSQERTVHKQFFIRMGILITLAIVACVAYCVERDPGLVFPSSVLGITALFTLFTCAGYMGVVGLIASQQTKSKGFEMTALFTLFTCAGYMVCGGR